MTIQTPTQFPGLMRLPMLALASALLVFGFAVGQVTPNLAGAIGAALDSPRTQVVAPALTRADDYGTRQAGAAPAVTRDDDYGTRSHAAARENSWAENYSMPHVSSVSAERYVERAGGR